MPSSPLRRFVILLFIPLWLLVAQASAQTFYSTVGITDSTGPGTWNMTPAAACTGAYLSGAIWCTTPVNFDLPFTLTYETKVNIVLGSGADGICVVFGQNLTPTSVNGNAGYIGYYNQDTSVPNAQFQQSFAVEFDIFNDYPIVNDPSGMGDHTMVARDGNPYRVTTGAAPITISPAGATIKDTVFHHYKITWCPANNVLNVYYEDSLRISSHFDYRTIFTTTTVNWGFTAGIGSSCSDQYLQNVVLSAVIDTTYTSSDTTGCNIDSINAPGGFSHYVWYNGDTTQTIFVPGTGTYWVVMTDTATCSYEVDTIHVFNSTSGGTTINVIDTSQCGTTPMTLTGPSGAGITYIWNNGATSSTITVDSSGTYWVNATTSCATIIDTFHVTMDTLPVLHLVGDTTLCVGSTVTLSSTGTVGNFSWSTGSTDSIIVVNTSGTYTLTVTSASGVCSVSGTTSVSFSTGDTIHTAIDTTLCGIGSHTLSGPAGYTSYLWSTAASTASITISTGGNYWVAASTACSLATDTFKVTIQPLPFIDLTGDSALCAGDTLVLNSPGSSGTFLWSNGSTDTSITVTTSGIYSLTITQNGCSATAEAAITFANTPPLNLGPDTMLCQGSHYFIYSGDSSSLWSTGATGAGITVSDSGFYWAELSNSCGSTRDTILVGFENCNCTVGLPSAFSPNNDGNNDILLVKGGLALASFDMKVYNRWGQMVYESTDINQGWNGIYNNQPQPVDVYVCIVLTVCKTGAQNTIVSNVTLLR